MCTTEEEKKKSEKKLYCTHIPATIARFSRSKGNQMWLKCYESVGCRVFVWISSADDDDDNNSLAEMVWFGERAWDAAHTMWPLLLIIINVYVFG